MGDGGLVRTALYEKHLEAGAKIVDFHGFELPIWYTSIQDEHLSCREKSGLFDVSHMGFFEFRGKDVLSWLSTIGTQQYMNFATKTPFSDLVVVQQLCQHCTRFQKRKSLRVYELKF